MTIKTFLPIILAASIFNAAPAVAASPEEFCENYHTLAMAVMLLRQKGTSLSEQVDGAVDAFADDSHRLDTALVYIEMAYDSPRYADREAQKAAAEGFAEGAYELCIKAILE